MLQEIQGGVCAAQGFSASGVHCGIRKNRNKKDLALIVSKVRAATACVYTQNLVKGAPILVTKKNVKDGYAQAVICNSGNANTCNANGVEIAEGMCRLVEKKTGIPASDVVVASTGVIGQPLSLDPIAGGMDELVGALGEHNSRAAAEAIMTTDTVPKEVAFSFEVNGVTCRIGAIAKGVGMLCPNMATMLMFVCSDAAITPELLQKALSTDVVDSLNMVSVDRDTSTNDTLALMANGMAGNPVICEEDEGYVAFCAALHAVTSAMCKKIAKDGEGATKLLECNVVGAQEKQTARVIAKSVINSPLVKSAMFGADANWGRVLCAIGYAGVWVDVAKIEVKFLSRKGEILVCKDGAGVDFSEELASEILHEDEIRINVDLHDGKECATAWGCDLTYDYVKINGDYRT